MRAQEAIRANQAAIAIASTIMMLRACVLVAILVPYLAIAYLGLLLPALAASAIASGLLLYRGRKNELPFDEAALSPPDLKLALLFGGFVAAMAVAAGWAEHQVQGSGAAVVALGGLFDVDSAIAALGTIPRATLSDQLASFAVAAPVVFNSFLKLGITYGVAGRKSALPPALALAAPAMLIAAMIAVSAL